MCELHLASSVQRHADWTIERMVGVRKSPASFEVIYRLLEIILNLLDIVFLKFLECYNKIVAKFLRRQFVDCEKMKMIFLNIFR